MLIKYFSVDTIFKKKKKTLSLLDRSSLKGITHYTDYWWFTTICLYKFVVSLRHSFDRQLFAFTFRTWWTRCGSVLLHKTRWRFAAVCPNSYLLSTKQCPISSVTNSAKSLWTLVARTGQCSTMTSLQTPFR